LGLPSLRFVDRVGELETLFQFSSRFRGVPLYIYGPEGCGKTRLLREFVRRFRGRFGGRGVAVYIDALERDSVERAVLASDSVGVVVEAAASIAENAAGQPLGRVLADRVATLLQKLAARLTLSGRYLVVAVDDVARAIGVENIERYVKWLYELLWKIGEDYNPKAVNIIVTTSEGQSLLLLGAYRDNEVDSTHPMMMVIDEMRKKEIEIHSIALRPLKKLHISHLLSETLLREPADVETLTEETGLPQLHQIPLPLSQP